MNRDCNGDFFTADGKRYYCCLMDGSVFLSIALNGDRCEKCNRVIYAVDHDDVEVNATKYVTINGSHVIIPE